MYYKKVGGSRNSYARLAFLNEMISGQDIHYIDDLMLYEKEPPLRFHQERCHMCLLGLKKSVYSGYYHLTANGYMEIYVTFERAAIRYLADHHLDGEIFLTLYQDKQIVVLFSLSEKSDVDAMDVARYLQDALQQLYQDTFLKDGVYCNQTFILKDPMTRAQIPANYKRLQGLTDLSIFLEAPGIFWPEMIREKRQRWPAEELRQLRRRLFNAVSDCDPTACAEALDRLLLNKVKSSFDLYLLGENLVSLKQFYEQVCNVYDIPIDGDMDHLFDQKRYPKIEHLAAKMQELFSTCMDPKIRKGQRYSRIVRESIQILKADLCRCDLSLTYVAEQINISPGYLSSAFNREVHSTIPQYILRLRIDKAKELLKDSRLNIGEIAASVGFANKRYFSGSFKRETGMTPKDYRTDHTL